MNVPTFPPAATSTGRSRAPSRPPLRWWRELAIAGAFYLIYSAVRNVFGAGPESRLIAFRHARSVIRVQDALGLWFEPELQAWYLSLPADGLIRVWNVFYGTAHFIVTIGVLVLAFRRAPHIYRFMRNVLAATTGLALIGFATYTLMPPRLLDDTGPYGACAGLGEECARYGIVDTIEEWGGLWTFGEGGVAAVSNQYAAMPSLHFGWSTWCAITLVLVIGRGRARWLAFVYPAATLFTILVTGNHYWLDAFFGGVALGAGAVVALLVTRATERWDRRRGRGPDDDAGATTSAPASPAASIT
jgi:hypothetical protein